MSWSSVLYSTSSDKSTNIALSSRYQILQSYQWMHPPNPRRTREASIFKIPMLDLWFSYHHPTQSACIVSATIVPSSCSWCTPTSKQPSWWSLLSYERQASFDHHNLIVCDRNDAFLAQRVMPCQPYTVSLCVGCAFCSPCPYRRCVWSWERWPVGIDFVSIALNRSFNSILSIPTSRYRYGKTYGSPESS